MGMKKRKKPLCLLDYRPVRKVSRARGVGREVIGITTDPYTVLGTVLDTQ
jgi:hypothetical protein